MDALVQRARELTDQRDELDLTHVDLEAQHIRAAPIDARRIQGEIRDNRRQFARVETELEGVQAQIEALRNNDQDVQEEDAEQGEEADREEVMDHQQGDGVQPAAGEGNLPQVPPAGEGNAAAVAPPVVGGGADNAAVGAQPVGDGGAAAAAAAAAAGLVGAAQPGQAPNQQMIDMAVAIAIQTAMQIIAGPPGAAAAALPAAAAAAAAPDAAAAVPAAAAAPPMAAPPAAAAAAPLGAVPPVAAAPPGAAAAGGGPGAAPAGAPAAAAGPWGLAPWAPAPARERAKIGTFTEDDPGAWRIFRRRFMEAKKLNQWTDTDAKSQVKIAITGEAAAVSQDIDVGEAFNAVDAAGNPHPNRKTFDAYITELDLRFIPTSESKLAISQFRSMRQEPGETCSQYVSRLRLKHGIAWRDRNPETDPEIIRQFILFLNDAVLVQYLQDRDPQTITEALRLAQTKIGNIMQYRAVTKSANPRGRIGCIDCLDESTGNLSLNAINFGYGSDTPTTTEANRRLRSGGLLSEQTHAAVGRVGCRHCYDPTHSSQRCPRRRNRGQQRGGPSGPGQQGQPRQQGVVAQRGNQRAPQNQGGRPNGGWRRPRNAPNSTRDSPRQGPRPRQQGQNQVRFRVGAMGNPEEECPWDLTGDEVQDYYGEHQENDSLQSNEGN